jgi:hypothetical protein
MADTEAGADEPQWVDEPAAMETLPPGAGLAAWAGLFGLLPHRFTPSRGEPRIAPHTCSLGVASWGLLLIGTPLVAFSFVGLIGSLFELLAFVLVVLFVARVLVETGGAPSTTQTAGRVGLILAVLVVLAAAWGPVGIFGSETNRLAEARYTLEKGALPTTEMRSTIWWETHSWLGLFATWTAAAALLPLSLRLLGVRAKEGLLGAAGLAAATGPLMLGFCALLLKLGWRSAP